MTAVELVERLEMLVGVYMLGMLILVSGLLWSEHKGHRDWLRSIRKARDGRRQ